MRIIEPNKIKRDNAYLIKLSIVFFVLGIIYKGVQKLAETILIVPFLSLLSESHDFRRDILITAFIIFISVFVIYIKRKGFYYLSNKHVYIIYGVLIYFLLFFRFDYYFYTEYFESGIKICDLILIWIFLLADFTNSFFIRKGSSQNESAGFLTDESKELAHSNGVGDLIESIIEKVRNIKTNESFTIGIVGEWGQGKTTFMKALSKKIESDHSNDFVQFEYNPWMYAKKDELTTQFLDEFAGFLSQYHSGASKAVKNYSKQILSLNSKGVEGIASTITSFIEQELSVSERSDDINTIIDEVNKRVIIYIDDLDRLSNDEILTVFKLIRNVANFKNTFFILGYDKEVVTESLKISLNAKHEIYLEKIVQLEVFLRKPSEKNLSTKLIEQLIEKLNPKVHYTAIEYLNNNSSLLKIEYAIFNHRDINRFINIFLLNYKYEIIDEVDFADFFNLQLLRYKYPLLHDELYYNKAMFLSNEDKELKVSFSPKQYYYLIDESNPITEKLCEKYFISKVNCKYVNLLLIELFSERKEPNSNVWDKVIYVKFNEINRIRFVFSFDTYFEYSFQGSLSPNLFNKARQGTYEEFLSKVKAWSDSENTQSDLSYFFSRLELNDIVSIDDLKNICKAAAYLVNNSENNHNYSMLLKKLLFNTEEGEYNKKLLSLFSSSKEIEDFVMELIESNESLESKVFNDFSNYVFHRGKNSVSEFDDLRERFIKYYDVRMNKYLDEESQFSYLLYHAVYDNIKCKIHHTPFKSLSKEDINNPIANDLKARLKKFIIDKGIDSFIWNGKESACIRRGSLNSYAFDVEFINEIYGSLKEFIEEVKKSESMFKKDIIGFCSKFIDDVEIKSNTYVDYDFEYIFQ